MLVADLETLLSPLLIRFISARPENQRRVARCFPFQPHHILAITILSERKSLVRLIMHVKLIRCRREAIQCDNDRPRGWHCSHYGVGDVEAPIHVGVRSEPMEAIRHANNIRDAPQQRQKPCLA
jgi:hypothetical protein